MDLIKIMLELNATIEALQTEITAKQAALSEAKSKLKKFTKLIEKAKELEGTKKIE